MDRHQEKIITRFAPSPTGFLHIGSARTALFNYFYAKKCGGEMILRIEDTDKERSKKEYEDDIIEGLSWLGISWTGKDSAHNEPYRQSERTTLYKTYLEKIVESGHAYVSEEEREGKQGSVIRFKNPNSRITFYDEIRGEVSFDTSDLGDFVIAKDMETPLYHFAVVVDDFLMGVTHVIRGEDGISNTPRQILIQEAIGAPRPVYAHIPLILGPDKSKLSKRHSAVSVNDFRKEGYLPDAFINFLALLGWSPQATGIQTDILSSEELFKAFLLEHIQKGGAMFDRKKLDSINRIYLLRLPPDEQEREVLARLPSDNPAIARKLVPLILERIHVWKDVETLVDSGEFGYFFAPPAPKPAILPWKGASREETREYLEHAADIIDTIDEHVFVASAMKDALSEYAEKKGKGNVFWPLRYALSGREKSPDPFIIAEIIGKKEVLSRIRAAEGLL